VVKIDSARAQFWIGKGARPSDTVRSLLKKTTAGTASAPAAESR
jgi:ribosomal protein S16